MKLYYVCMNYILFLFGFKFVFKILIQKRSPKKKLEPNVWAMTGGSVIKGETLLEALKRTKIKSNMKIILLLFSTFLYILLFFLLQIPIFLL